MLAAYLTMFFVADLENICELNLTSTIGGDFMYSQGILTTRIYSEKCVISDFILVQIL